MDLEFIVNEQTVSTFRVVRMLSDGSCLFHAISYLIYGRQLNHYSRCVRQRVVAHVLSNWERLKVWTQNITDDNYSSPDHYQREMLKLSTYGSACELIAASELFYCRFKVYRDGHLLYTFGADGAPVKHLKFSGYNLSSGHFDAYEPIQTSNVDPKLLMTPTVVLEQYTDCKIHNQSIISRPDDTNTIDLNIEHLDDVSRESLEPKVKRAKRRGRFSNTPRLKQLREAAAKYRKTHTELHKAAVSKYTQQNPEVHRAAVTKYTDQNPEVHRAAVAKYTDQNPEVHRAAVAKYTQQNPEVHRAAVAKYTQQNPEVHRAAVAKYTEENPEVHRAAVAKYDQINENRLLRKIKAWIVKAHSGYRYDPNICYESDKTIMTGSMDIVCNHCNAMKWKGESKGLCCDSGKVRLDQLNKRPEPLHSLALGDHPDSEHFLNNIRKYNSAFQMTSFGAKQIIEGSFMPTFKVQGQVYHLIGSLLPLSNNNHQFLQMYFIGDDNKETDARCEKFSSIKPSLVHILQKMLHNCNRYVRDFKCALDNMPADGETFQVVIHADKKPNNTHRGRYNEPTAREVGVVIVGQEFEKRDIVLKSRDNKLQRISETHRAYDALQYPLLFCYGEDGYSTAIPQFDPVTKQPVQKTVSAASFYSFHLMVRRGEVNYLLYFRGLLNQFLVDMYAKIESERLKFIRNNQKKLRVESYIHLKDAVSSTDTNPEDIGQAVILPSTFTGGARYMHERTQDAMTYVRHYGRPDLFITFTSNPKWTEITETLFIGQKPQDRQDLISRVFHIKVKTMINLLTKANIFGPSICYMYTIEWQKRGLPHAHILLWLKDKIKPVQIDQFICAEIPDPKADPKLHNIVKSTMIHGPCGDLNKKSPCMNKGLCSKKYPQSLLRETQTGDDGYPKYRRRAPNDGGYTVNINNVTVDNRWVVPYSPVLSRIFHAHINVEYCNSVKSIKYVCKYINKGSDQAVFCIGNQLDEVSRYESGRYISSSEAAWRIFCFPIHERFPPVFHLSVHLENGQRVYYTSKNFIDRINNPSQTTLLGFFELCKNDDFAKELLYCEVPAYYVWKSNKFVRRKQGVSVPGHLGLRKDRVLGRVYTVHPNNDECYYLRLLLHEVRGPTSFQHLKTVRGTVHSTFKAACRALGLLEDDSNWDHTLEEAALSDSPHKIRELYAMMLVFCQVSNPVFLWEKYRDSLSEDLKHKMENKFHGVSFHRLVESIQNQCLVLLEDLVLAMGGQRLQHYGLPETSRDQFELLNRDYICELSYDIAELTNIVEKNENKLNDDQKVIYETVNSSIASNSGILYFLDAPGGTGKTFLMNLLITKVRMNKQIAVAVASTGIAATLLYGGKTAHSAFKLPLNMNNNEMPLCNISKQSNMAAVLRDCQLIVWDEITMSHRGAIEALDRTLRDVRNNNNLMGGATVLLAGDFRQTLPVVPRGTRADEVKACLKSSHLWHKIKVISLRVNMRVHLKGDVEAGQFADLLLRIGDGKMVEEGDKIIIPKQLCTIVSDLRSLIQNVYPDLKNILKKEMSWLSERAILTPKNEMAAEVNKLILEEFTSEMRCFKSLDSVIESDDAVHYPVEFLNTLNPPGMPDHKLTLKVGAPIMLLRNLHPPKLCNGTRLKVTFLRTNIIEAVILTGFGKGETVFIPRIPLIPSDYPFQFKRIQFPVRLSFAMTINKAQGQSLRQVGVNLQEDCFSHGQLYVACSRVSSADSLVLLQPDGRTANIVYQEVLRN